MSYHGHFVIYEPTLVLRVGQAVGFPSCLALSVSLQVERPGTPWHVQDLPGLDMLIAEAVVSKR